MHNSTWLAATAMIGVGSFAVPAQADLLQPNPRRAPSMEEMVVLTGSERAVILDRLVQDIKYQMQPSDPSFTTVDDVLQSPALEGLLDGLLDEDGQLNLPLGLTIYDTMGDTSVGFSTQF